MSLRLSITIAHELSIVKMMIIAIGKLCSDCRRFVAGGRVPLKTRVCKKCVKSIMSGVTNGDRQFCGGLSKFYSILIQ